jgi:hypothetical protein
MIFTYYEDSAKLSHKMILSFIDNVTSLSFLSILICRVIAVLLRGLLLFVDLISLSLDLLPNISDFHIHTLIKLLNTIIINSSKRSLFIMVFDFLLFHRLPQIVIHLRFIFIIEVIIFSLLLLLLFLRILFQKLRWLTITNAHIMGLFWGHWQLLLLLIFMRLYLVWLSDFNWTLINGIKCPTFIILILIGIHYHVLVIRLIATLWFFPIMLFMMLLLLSLQHLLFIIIVILSRIYILVFTRLLLLHLLSTLVMWFHRAWIHFLIMVILEMIFSTIIVTLIQYWFLV